jgi:CCR4-NOT transcription complex subunit 3
MSNRKLLGEIERVLKKVDEGVAVFEQIWDKVYGASTTAQKEKYEADLKKEIKKLQRLRDQIKTWQGDSSVKDKTKLDSNRRLIEEKMEKFKVCEKETKTKAFSKEGLAQDRTDPKQKAKAEVGDWVRDSISRLREQSDEFEAEIEQLSTGTRRKKRGEEPPPRVAELKACIARHEHHVEMLERVLRAIDNEQVTPQQCNDELKDSVEFYIEESQEGGDYDDEGMYDSLNLEAVVIPTAVPAAASATCTGAAAPAAPTAPASSAPPGPAAPAGGGARREDVVDELCRQGPDGAGTAAPTTAAASTAAAAAAAAAAAGAAAVPAAAPAGTAAAPAGAAPGARAAEAAATADNAAGWTRCELCGSVDARRRKGAGARRLERR